MSRTFQVILALGVGAAVSLGGQAPTSPTPQTPTFRVEVNYVEIDARATDAQGRFVDDLNQNEFQVVEDGSPQTISVFTRVRLPLERQDPPLFKGAPIEPDVQSNLHEFNGRVFTTSVTVDKYRIVDGVVIPERYSQRFDLGQFIVYADFKSKDILVNTELANDVFTSAN